MAEVANADGLRCALCGIPIIRPEYMVEVDGNYYPCPTCAWAAANPDLVKRLRRGGGMVLACDLCHAPIIFSEIIVHQDGKTYCCPNDAEVARRRAEGA